MGEIDLNALPEPWDTIALIAAAFVVAWIISRSSQRLAEFLVGRYQARHFDPENATSGVIMGLKRRATIVSLVQTSVRYAAYGLAILFAVTKIAGFGGAGAVAGASLFILLVGFALQRFLIDILTGLFMQFEGWFAVGDSIIIEPWNLAGVVEEISLRSTRLRSVTGEVIRVHNGNVYGARVLPRGTREVSIEIFVRDEAEGRRVLTDISRVMPAGPTQFIRQPWIESCNQLDGDLDPHAGPGHRRAGPRVAGLRVPARRAEGARAGRADRARAGDHGGRRDRRHALRGRGAARTGRPLTPGYACRTDLDRDERPACLARPRS